MSLQHDRVLLTGATGVLGSYLMKELLETSESKIYCLIRAESNAHARTRLLTFLRIYDPSLKLQKEFNERVIPVIGDVSSHLLGLTESDYAELKAKIDVVVHSAAVTNLFLRMSRVEPTNITGTQNIIDFTLQTKQRYLCYISTHTIVGDKVFDHSVRFKESDYDIGQGFSYMTYQESKFRGEKMVRDAKERGLRWVIVRPGQIFGDSQSGNYPLRESNVSGLFYDILKTVIQTKLAMQSDTHFDVVPVDYVARATITLGLDPDSLFETYHLTNPDIKTYSDVIRIVKKVGYDVTIIPQEEYKRRLLASEVRADGNEYKSSTTSAFKWWFKRGFMFYKSAITDCTLTAEKLAQKGVFCPPIDERLMRTYLNTAARENYLPALERPSTLRSYESAMTHWPEATI